MPLQVLTELELGVNAQNDVLVWIAVKVFALFHTATIPRPEDLMKRRLQRFRISIPTGTHEENTRRGEINGIPYIEKLARIFRGGNLRGRIYTEGDIQRLVDNFRKPASDIDWTVPLYRDHPPHTGDYASIDRVVGSVRSLERRGMELWGWLRFVGQDSIDKVLSGIFRKLSAGIYYEQMILDEVSAVPDPYFDDTQVFSKSEREDTAVPDDEKDNDKNQPGKEPSRRKRLDRQPDNDSFANQLASVNDKWEARSQQLLDKLAALEARDAAREKELDQYRSDRLANTAAARVETFRAAGKTTRAMAGPEKDFVQTLSDDQFAKYEKVKEAAPELFSYGLQGDVGDEPTNAGDPIKRPGGEQSNTKAKVSRLVQKYGKDLKEKMKEEV